MCCEITLISVQRMISQKFHQFSYFEIENTGKVKRDSNRKIQRVKRFGPLFVEQIETFRYTVLPFEKRGILSSEQCAFRTVCSLVQNRITLPPKTKKKKKRRRESFIYIYTAWKNFFSVRFFIEFPRTHISIANKSFFRGVAAWSFESEKKKFINPRIERNLTTNWLEEKNNIHGGGSDPGTTRISSLYRGMERNRPYLAMSIINRKFTWGVNFFTSFWKSLGQVLTRPGNF